VQVAPLKRSVFSPSSMHWLLSARVCVAVKVLQQNPPNSWDGCWLTQFVLHNGFKMVVAVVLQFCQSNFVSYLCVLMSVANGEWASKSELLLPLS